MYVVAVRKLTFSQASYKQSHGIVIRSIHESSRDVARAIAETNAYQQSRNDRKKVEILFAHLKRTLKLDRLRLRGISEPRHSRAWFLVDFSR
jgi:hypothetical protein